MPKIPEIPDFNGVKFEPTTDFTKSLQNAVKLQEKKHKFAKLEDISQIIIDNVNEATGNSIAEAYPLQLTLNDASRHGIELVELVCKQCSQLSST